MVLMSIALCLLSFLLLVAELRFLPFLNLLLLHFLELDTSLCQHLFLLSNLLEVSSDSSIPVLHRQL